MGYLSPDLFSFLFEEVAENLGCGGVCFLWWLGVVAKMVVLVVGGCSYCR